MKLGPPGRRRANRIERGGDDTLERKPGIDDLEALRPDLVAELLIDHGRRRV